MSTAPTASHTDLPVLERFGLAVLRRSPGHPAVAPADDPIHVLNPDERRALRKIERGALLRAAAAGALSGSASAGTAIWAHRFLGPDGSATSTTNALLFWGTVGGATLVASIFEIGFLYWDALRSVHRMATAAGLRLSAEELSNDQREVALALARAALELPNPPERVWGVDPRRESIRWLVALAAVLYKAKIALTNLLVKGILRSLIGRAAMHAALELVTVPVTALWNVVVCRLVVREARLRAMGPSAALELVGLSLSDVVLSETARAMALRAVASAVVRTHDLHPNHVAVMRAVSQHVGTVELEAIEEIDDSQRFIQDLSRVDRDAQTLALRVLVISAILDGRLTRAERRLLEEAFSACGRKVELRRVERLRRAFSSGEGVGIELILELTDTPQEAAV